MNSVNPTYTARGILAAALFIFAFASYPMLTHAAASGTITAVQTVANVPAGTNDQTAATVTTTANAAQVKAALTLTVNSLPVASTTSTVGSCVITYSTTVADNANCSGNAAIANVSTHNATSTLATYLRTLSGVSATGHGGLSVTGSGAQVIFTTTGTETSATAIGFADTTSGAVSSTTSVTGVVAAAQVNTITVGGTVDTGDVFTATLPGSVTASYTAVPSDTATLVATGLNTAIHASAGYAGQAFTSAASTNTVVLTAKAAGTGFVQTSSATNYPGVAQVVVFTPANVSASESYEAVINGHTYSGDGSTVAAVTAVLNNALATDTDVTCTEDGSAVTCTANVPGTAFTYSASAIGAASSGGSSHHGGGGGGGSSSSSSSATANASLQAQVNSLLATLATLQAKLGLTTTTTSSTGGSVGSLTMDLTLNASGSSVTSLQTWLIGKGFSIPAGATGFFGAQTQAALAAYQSANGITPAAGYFGAKTRAFMASHP